MIIVQRHNLDKTVSWGTVSWTLAKWLPTIAAVVTMRTFRSSTFRYPRTKRTTIPPMNWVVFRPKEGFTPEPCIASASPMGLPTVRIATLS